VLTPPSLIPPLVYPGVHVCPFFSGIHSIQKRTVPLHICQIDWLIIYCFTFRSIFFHLHGDVTIDGEGLQNLGLCSALRAFEQGGIFVVPHLLWYGTSVFRSHPRDRPIQLPLTTRMGMRRICSNRILMGRIC
jgi:hypothetical protein